MLYSQKKIIYIFVGLCILSLWSIYYTPNVKESIGEIKGELIRNFFLLAIFFYFILYTHYEKHILIMLTLILFFNTSYNIITWIVHGGFPFRAGGLLDNGGGERFGIWATYSLALAIALCFSSYKKYGFILLFLSVISIFANNTRATYIAVFLMLAFICYLIVKNKKILFICIGLLSICTIIYYHYSDTFSNKYNLKNTLNHYEKFLTLSPSEYIILEQDYDIDHSISSRLAMWKSVILFRLKDPITPQGYGRFLYGKSIKQNFSNEPQNIPFTVYSQTHNDFIGIFYSLGFIGLIIFIYFLFIPLSVSYKIYQNSANEQFKILSLTILLGTIGFIGSMLFGSFFGDSESKFFYCLLGILLGINYKETHENHISKTA